MQQATAIDRWRYVRSFSERSQPESGSSPDMDNGHPQTLVARHIGGRVTRTRSFASNALWSLALQLVTVLVGFLVPRAIIGTYGSQVNGLVSSLTQMIGYISLVEAGISTAAIFALYQPLADKDYGKVSSIVSDAKRFYYQSGFFFVLLTIALAIVYPLYVDCDFLDSQQVAAIVISLGAVGFLDFFTLAKYRVLLTADQRNWVIQIASIVYKILYAATILILAYGHVSIEIVYIVSIVPIVVRTCVLVLYSKKKYPHIVFDVKRSGKKLDQRWDAFYLQILGAVQSGFPILAATFFVGDLSLVSVFSVYLLISNGIQSICTSLTGGTQATFGEVMARGDYKVLRRAYSEAAALVGILNSALCATSSLMIVPFVSLYVGYAADINYIRPGLGFLIILNVFLYHLKTPEGLLVVSAGKYHESRPYVTIQAIILIVGSSVGALFGGLEGIMIGPCASNIFAAAYLSFFVPGRISKTKKRSTIKRMAVSILSFLPWAVVSLAIPIDISSWAEWILACCLLSAITLLWAVLLFYLFDRKSILGLYGRLKGLVWSS